MEETGEKPAAAGDATAVEWWFRSPVFSLAKISKIGLTFADFCLRASVLKAQIRIDRS
jgi:hypothetical protein